MTRPPARRRPGRLLLSAACAVALVAAAALGGTPLGLAAPFSGSVYDTVARGDERVENPYGTARVWYDGAGVPHVRASNERALYFAVGYLQARDRLFQMDLQRRLVRGNLSGAFGDRALDSDRFHRKLDFEGAAEASWAELRDTAAAPPLRAFSAGVNRYRERGPLPPEFRLAGYRPAEWTPVDSLLVAKLLAWRLSGSFAELRRATVRERLGPDAEALYPDRLDHDVPVIRGASDAAPFDPNGSGVTVGTAGGDGRTVGTEGRDIGTRGRDDAGRGEEPTGAGDFAALYERLAPYDAPAGVGSNSWVVAGRETANGTALLANDPHLPLTVPPVFYEMHLRTGRGAGTGSDSGGMDVRGAGIPGIPFVVVGRTADVAWGVTNVGADVTDHYTYETRGGAYRYRGGFRAFRNATETVPVAGDDGTRTVEVQVRKTVHGPVVEREGRAVAVAWTGFSATREALAAYRLNHAGSVADARAALRTWDAPPQNFVVAGRDGGTLYYPAGRYPVRRTDGRVVRGDRVFDGSRAAGEWAGFEPYGRSNWTGPGFVPFERVPHLDDPAYVATANQRVVDDPPMYLGDRFADPYRARRLYGLLDRRVESGDPVDPAFVTAMQRDVRSTAADAFVPYATAPRAVERMPPRAARRARALRSWDRRLTADSEAALLYRRWLAAFRNATFADEFGARGLDEGYYPRDAVLAGLPPDSRWFDDVRTPATETRADIAALAMRRAVDRIEATGHREYGDYNRFLATHPFDRAFLNYPERAMDGSPYTVFNFRRSATGTPVGSSWRMVVSFDGRSKAALPGGNSGVFWSEHYHDRVDEWAAGGYTPLTLSMPEGPPDVVFVRSGGDG